MEQVETINMKLPKELFDWLDARAAVEFESTAAYVRRLLIAHWRAETAKDSKP
jgi:hypothetical protein